MPDTPPSSAPSADDRITIVSGLPRSGTSMMMRMLAAAGMPILTDSRRSPDADNPHGYFELEAVKRTRADAAWVHRAAGSAVKVIHVLLTDLPPTARCRVIMMRRDLDEVLASQQKMLQRAGRPPRAAAIPPEILKRTYAEQLRTIDLWLAARPNTPVLQVHYAEVLSQPMREASRIAAFMGGSLAAEALAGAVDPALYRNRREAA